MSVSKVKDFQNFFFEEGRARAENEQKEVARIQNGLPLAYRSIFLAQSRRRDKQAPPTKATFLHMLGTPRRARKRGEWRYDLLLNWGHSGAPKKKVKKKTKTQNRAACQVANNTKPMADDNGSGA